MSGMFIYPLPSPLNALAAGDASRAQSAAERATSQVRSLEDRIDRLSLVCAALWTLIKQATPLTDEQLMKRVEDLDLSDGKLDGKIHVDAQECSGCHRVLSPRFLHCLYCGRELPRTGPFDLRS